MTEELKAKARRIWEEIFPNADVERLAEVIAEDSIDHGARPDEPQGLAGVEQTMFWLGSVFSDQRWEIRQVIGEGDTVVVYCTLHGRHTGNLLGIPGETAFAISLLARFRDLIVGIPGLILWQLVEGRFLRAESIASER